MAPTQPDAGTGTLLVVDDEADILDAVRRLFRKTYRVLTAQSVEEALEWLEREPVEVVLADQRLPRSTGIELFADIRRRYPEIVRVLFTGYTNIDDVIDAINQGHVYRYISKPWKPAELRLLIDQAFEYHRGQRERADLLAQLQEANAKLEQQNGELVAANAELKNMDRVRRVFMEVISHELNTPIAIIIGYTFLLRRELEELDAMGVAHKSVDRIEASSKRLKRISERIFQMISLDQPDHTLNFEPLDLRELITELHQQVEPFLDQRSQRLIADIEQPHEPLVADPTKLLDALLHLVINAIKFSPDGETIRLHARPAPPDQAIGQERVAISVRDNGVGIPAEDLPQVFEVFFSTFRTGYHSSGEFEFGKRGMGLGLSIARQFVQMHGGEISVESEEGRGSTFTIYLPRDPAASTSIR